MTAGLAVVVLAAGAGSRMGGIAKCLIERNGVPLLRTQLRSVNALSPVATVLVLGHHAKCINRAMRLWNDGPPPMVVVNQQPGDDPASSLRTGLTTLLELPAAFASIMVLLADQPLISTRDLRDACKVFDERASHQRMSWPVHGEVPGHPMLLESNTAQDWSKQENTGLRTWARKQRVSVLEWDPGHDRCTTDLDTPGDLSRLSRVTGVVWTLPRPSAEPSPTRLY